MEFVSIVIIESMEELDLGWQIIKGKENILVIAGHNFAHGREGKIKFADLGTGDIARKLAEKYKFWGIISTREQMDPNWYVESSFREKIRELIKDMHIKLIIDIHGKSLGFDKLVEIKGNKKFKKKYTLEVGSFMKNNQMTIAEEFDNLIPSLQIEIREDGRVRTINEVKYNEIQYKIDQIINKLINKQAKVLS